MKLYMVPLAPNPVKVMLYIAERQAQNADKGGADMGIEQIIINTHKAQHRTPEHLARNPFGSLPVLETETGDYILESRAIIDYLEDIIPTARLFDDDPLQRAKQRDMERICEIRLTNYLGEWVHVYDSPIGFPSDLKRAETLEARMQPAFDYLDTILSDGRPFLCGAKASPADCTLQAGLNFMRFTDRDLTANHTHIQKWDNHYRNREPVISVIGTP